MMGVTQKEEYIIRKMKQILNNHFYTEQENQLERCVPYEEIKYCRHVQRCSFVK